MAKKRDTTWYARFLMEYAGQGFKTIAAKEAGISTRTVYRALDDDPDFAEEFARAETLHKSPVYQATYKLACKGDKVFGPLYLKAFFPKMFADKQQVEHSGGIEIITIPASPERDDEIDRALREAGVDPEHP